MNKLLELGLTKSEAMVTLEFIKGGTKKEVGNSLFLSWMTIRNHLYRVYKKLDVHSRTQLAIKVAHIRGRND